MPLLPKGEAEATGNSAICINELSPKSAKRARGKRVHRLTSEGIFECSAAQSFRDPTDAGGTYCFSRQLKIKVIAGDTEQRGDHADLIVCFCNERGSTFEHVPWITFARDNKHCHPVMTSWHRRIPQHDRSVWHELPCLIQ
jgi:hypothetical protein